MFPFSITRSFKTTFPLLDEAAEHFTVPNAAGSVRASPLEAVVGFLFKRSAKHLRAHLARVHGLELTHGQALDAVSAGLGCADWNTANARLQMMVLEDQGGLLTASAQAAAEAQELGPWRQGSLRSLVDFNASSAIVGQSGSGKSVGLLFALKAQLTAGLGRPLLVLHGREDGRQSPNWTDLLSNAPTNVHTWAADSQFSMGESDIHDVVQVTGDALALPAESREDCQQALAAELLLWLAPRAHLRPLLIVDEAYELLGRHAGQFLLDLPAGVVVIWLAQSAQDLGLAMLSKCFDTVHLLSMPRGPRDAEVMGLSPEQLAQLVRRFAARTIGQAVSIPLRASHPEAAGAGAEFEMDRALRERVLSAIKMSLPHMRLQHHTLPPNIPVSAWRSGKQLLVMEVKLRERVLGHLSAEDQAVVARVRRQGAPVSGLTLLMLDALNTAGWLVCQVGATTVPPEAALWDIKAGKLPYHGVLVLELPGAHAAPDDDRRPAPLVTGHRFAEPTEASKRLRGLLRTPLRQA
jgi:hypothetical protein